MKTKLLTSLLALTTLISTNVFAGSSYGKLKSIDVYQGGGGIIIFDVGDEHKNKPACSTSGNNWALDTSTSKGMAMYSALLLAAAKNKNVRIDGSGDCADWGDRERPAYIAVIL